MVTVRKKLRVVELYAGTGRASEPFRRWKRAEIGFLADNSDLARQTYLHNFPGSPYENIDIANVTINALAKKCGNADVVLGCPPCQGFSDVGTRKVNDERNAHLLLFGAIALQLKPLAIAMENVPAAGASSEFRQLTQMLGVAEYRWTAGILNAAVRGSSQCRQRLVLLAFRSDVHVDPVIPQPTHGGARHYFCYSNRTMRSLHLDPLTMLGEAPTSRLRDVLKLPHIDHVPKSGDDVPTVSEVLDGLPAIGSTRAKYIQHFEWQHTSKMKFKLAALPEGARLEAGADHYSHTYGRLHRRGLARTITTFFPNPGSGRFVHPTEHRTLTLREAARIQGFPDSFRFLGPFSRAATLVGNALDAAIAKVSFNVIRDVLG